MQVVGVELECIGKGEAVRRVLSWTGDGRSHGVAFVNTHMSMEAHDDASFAADLAAFDLRLPDGMPVVWTARLLGANGQEQVDGPATTQHLLAALGASGCTVGFYGSAPKTIAGLVAALQRDHPGLRVVYAKSPAFARQDPPTTQQDLADMLAAGVQVLFVGLGCPKQERWIARRLAEGVPLVMLGVGQVFDLLAGTRVRAPTVFRRTGTEWLYRFAHEPRRLGRRVLVLGPRYVLQASRQVLKKRSAR